MHLQKSGSPDQTVKAVWIGAPILLVPIPDANGLIQIPQWMSAFSKFQQKD